MPVQRWDIRNGYPVIPPVDLIFADVPYGTGRKFHDYNDSVEVGQSVITAVLSGAKDCLKEGGYVVLMADHRLSWFVRSQQHANTYGLSFVSEIIWRFNSGGAGKKKIPQKHATLSVFSKGTPAVFNVLREPYPRNYGDRKGFHPDGRMITSVWSIPILSTTDPRRVGYSTEKPPALLERLLQVYTRPGAVVYDPCCGGGSLAEAARTTGRVFYGSDINERAVEITRQRMTLGEE